MWVNNTNTDSVVRRSAGAVVWVAAVFSFAIAILLLVNHVQMTRVDPLNSPGLTSLHKQFTTDSSSKELKEEIRALDLLVRRAFFISQAQVRTGGYLLLGGVAVLIVALQVAGALRPVRPMPSARADELDAWSEMRLARAVIGGVCIALFGAALAVGLRPQPDLLAVVQVAPVTDTAVPRPVPQPQRRAEKLTAAALNWPNFRGPGGRGVATHTNAPVLWDGATGNGIAWKTTVPRHGFSSPVVWGDKLFVTGGDEEVREVFAFDTGSGKLVWRHAVLAEPGMMLPEVSEDTGFAAPSAATDGKRVFAIFATGDLVALDMQGNELWARHMGVPANHYAHASSLLVHGDRLFVQLDDDEYPRLLALSPSTGEELWKVPRDAISWSSPICAGTGNRTELILTSSKTVASYDPATGREYWSFECLDAEVGASAAYADGWVFACNEYATGTGIKLGETTKIAWTWDENLPDASSPVASGKYLVVATGYGTVSCLDLHSGTLFWEEEFDDGFYSSPVIVDGRVYVSDLEGVTHVFKLGEQYEAIAALPLGEAVTATPAFLDGVIYIRGEQHLFRVDGVETIAPEGDGE